MPLRDVSSRFYAVGYRRAGLGREQLERCASLRLEWARRVQAQARHGAAQPDSRASGTAGRPQRPRRRKHRPHRSSQWSTRERQRVLPSCLCPPTTATPSPSSGWPGCGRRPETGKAPTCCTGRHRLRQPQCPGRTRLAVRGGPGPERHRSAVPTGCRPRPLALLGAFHGQAMAVRPGPGRHACRNPMTAVRSKGSITRGGACWKPRLEPRLTLLFEGYFCGSRCLAGSSPRRSGRCRAGRKRRVLPVSGGGRGPDRMARTSRR